MRLDLTPSQKADLARRMRVPLLSAGALLALLALNVALGAVMPFASVWIVEMAVALAMIVVVLLFSMEVLHEPPLMRLFSVLGFCWVGILFAMTMVDYLTR